jgi:mRNA interferase HicA
MKNTEFIRWLTRKGCVFKQAKGSHMKVFYDNRQSVVPVHKGKDIKEGTRRAIMKQLGLKEDDDV